MISTIWETLEHAGQTTVFGSIGLIGFVYLAISALFGGLGHESDISDHDVGHSDSGDTHGDSTVSIFSLKVIAIFLVGFGGVGATASHYGASTMLAITSGFGAGFVFGIVGLIMLRAMYRQQSNSAIDTNNAVGKIEQITIAIPQNGIGEVSLAVQGVYTSYSARSADGQPLMYGQSVHVVSNLGGQLIVRS